MAVRARGLRAYAGEAGGGLQAPIVQEPVYAGSYLSVWVQAAGENLLGNSGVTAVLTVDSGGTPVVAGHLTVTESGVRGFPVMSYWVLQSDGPISADYVGRTLTVWATASNALDPSYTPIGSSLYTDLQNYQQQFGLLYPPTAASTYFVVQAPPGGGGTTSSGGGGGTTSSGGGGGTTSSGSGGTPSIPPIIPTVPTWWQSLPTWEKIGLVGGAGLLLLDAVVIAARSGRR
jgi:uncharacterized membrane protein YgcG